MVVIGMMLLVIFEENGVDGGDGGGYSFDGAGIDRQGRQ